MPDRLEGRAAFPVATSRPRSGNVTGTITARPRDTERVTDGILSPRDQALTLIRLSPRDDRGRVAWLSPTDSRERPARGGGLEAAASAPRVDRRDRFRRSAALS